MRTNLETFNKLDKNNNEYVHVCYSKTFTTEEFLQTCLDLKTLSLDEKEKYRGRLVIFYGDPFYSWLDKNLKNFKMEEKDDMPSSSTRRQISIQGDTYNLKELTYFLLSHETI